MDIAAFRQSIKRGDTAWIIDRKSGCVVRAVLRMRKGAISEDVWTPSYGYNMRYIFMDENDRVHKMPGFWDSEKDKQYAEEGYSMYDLFYPSQEIAKKNMDKLISAGEKFGFNNRK